MFWERSVRRVRPLTHSLCNKSVPVCDYLIVIEKSVRIVLEIFGEVLNRSGIWGILKYNLRHTIKYPSFV